MSPDDRPAVLLVDDRTENLLALEAVLAPLDLRLVRALNGKQALRWLLTDEFAVILLDVQMPELDGFETARHIKERERTRDVPIIFLTAINTDIEHQLQGYGYGAIDYLAKPFEPKVLLAKVSVLVRLYEQTKVIEEQNEQLATSLAELQHADAALGRQALELERSNAELDRFAAVAAHDLREPLHIVRGFLDLLVANHTDDLGRSGAALAEKAQRGVARMYGLLDGLEQYARASIDEPVLGSVSLDDELRAAEANLGDLLRDATITHDPLPTVTADARQMRQVFEEILAHAAVLPREGPLRVHVSLSRREDEWVVGVHDHGRGMTAADVTRLFTPFSRIASDPGRAGSAAGLAMCKRIVERHGGTIWADSAVGRGTTVSFALPGARP